MSLNLNIASVEQLSAEGLAGLVISRLGAGDATKTVAAANGALAFAAGLTSLSNGDPSAASAAINAEIQAGNLDPAVADSLQKLVQFGLQQAAIGGAIASFVPLLGADAQAVMQNVGAGITSAANLEIKKYQASKAQGKDAAEKQPVADAATKF